MISDQMITKSKLHRVDIGRVRGRLKGNYGYMRSDEFLRVRDMKNHMKDDVTNYLKTSDSNKKDHTRKRVPDDKFDSNNFLNFIIKVDNDTCRLNTSKREVDISFSSSDVIGSELSTNNNDDKKINNNKKKKKVDNMRIYLYKNHQNNRNMNKTNNEDRNIDKNSLNNNDRNNNNNDNDEDDGGDDGDGVPIADDNAANVITASDDELIV